MEQLVEGSAVVARSMDLVVEELAGPTQVVVDHMGPHLVGTMETEDFIVHDLRMEIPEARTTLAH